MEKDIFDGLQAPSSHFDVKQNSRYIYSTILSLESVRLTLGLSYDDYDEDTLHVDRYNPKLGFVWDIAETYLSVLLHFEQ